jgi:hypothetical protein
MRDEFDDRMWVEHGAAFSAALSRLFAQVGVAFKKLNQIQFDAPWHNEVAPRTRK